MFLYRQTNTDFKISLQVCAQIKIMPIKFRILYPTNSRVLYPLNAFFGKQKVGYFSVVNKHLANLAAK